MEKIIAVVGMLLLVSGVSFAITTEELQGAKVTLREIQTNIHVMNLAVNTALRGNAVGIDLTADQIQTLKDRYVTKKSELQQLYSELP